MKVVIDGQLYVPAREAQMDVREAVARMLADQFWGGLDKDDWEKDFDEKMSGICFTPNEEGRGQTAHELLDMVVAFMNGG